MQQQKIKTKKIDEKILVLERDILFPTGSFTGIKGVDFDYYQKLIIENKKFLWRSKVEYDPSHKQIIPYLVFSYQDKFFLMQRKSDSTEKRLRSKYSLGIGGHIRQEDVDNNLNIFDWAKREFAEEIEYSSNYEIEPIGFLNDESNDVGKVHSGFVFLLRGDSDKIRVRSELKSGQLFTLKQCKEFYDLMEDWTKLVFDYLILK